MEVYGTHGIDLKSLKWVRPRASEHEMPMTVDIQKVNDSWAKDKDMYIGPGGTGNAIRNRYERFIGFLHGGEPIEMPQISWGEWSKNIQFTNGRHRFSVLRDMGLKKIPAMIPKKQEKLFKQYFT